MHCLCTSNTIYRQVSISPFNNNEIKALKLTWNILAALFTRICINAMIENWLRDPMLYASNRLRSYYNKFNVFI